MVKHTKLRGQAFRVSGETRDRIPATTLWTLLPQTRRPGQLRAILTRNCSEAGILARYAPSQPNEPPHRESTGDTADGRRVALARVASVREDPGARLARMLVPATRRTS